MKKILVVDDSALMRRVLCDIITSGKKYEVTDVANNGFIALELLEQKSYDAVVLDINMPKMTGVELLRELRKRNIRAKILMASTDTKAGADITMECLELGALDFVHKPGSFLVAKGDEFQTDLLRALDSVVESRITTIQPNIPQKPIVDQKFFELVQKHSNKTNHQKVIAIASSTGGPRALQSVISQLPENLAAPVVIVQHMPAGFTKSFAERLNSMSRLQVSEAVEGEEVKVGHVYIAMGGKHLTILEKGKVQFIHYTDEPNREGVKPCANYLFESLVHTGYGEVLCVVLTGMGADGTQGITSLTKEKNVTVLAQNQETCAVFGMPRSIIATGLVSQVLPIEQISQEIIMKTGVR